MTKSQRFDVLEKELDRLEEQFLPGISPIGEYSERDLASTLAYKMFAHAEIEAYLEDRAWDVAINAHKNWTTKHKPSRTLISLIAFSGQMMELPPNTLTPIRGSKKNAPEKIELDEKIKLAINSFNKVIRQNHGVKEANLLALLLPIGINSNDIDPFLLATMNTFGEQRGLVAHSSARAIQLPDPATELDRIKQITEGLIEVDSLINNLID